MKTENISIPNAEGDLLHALLDFPDAEETYSYALFAHCFTCSAHLKVVTHICETLTAQGIAVVRFDFTGLGHSEGEFADTNFSSNSQDLISVASYMEKNWEAPQLLIGHSLGGAAVLNVAALLPSVRGVATINAPAEPSHVRKLVDSAEEEILKEGFAQVKIAGRAFTVKKQFLEDLEQSVLMQQIVELDCALLVMHAPRDTIVGVDNAAKIFEIAKHPKSYVSLDTADHLLQNPDDARYAAKVIAAWFSRYQKTKN